jgi:hypothetical protein
MNDLLQSFNANFFEHFVWLIILFAAPKQLKPFGYRSRYKAALLGAIDIFLRIP